MPRTGTVAGNEFATSAAISRRLKMPTAFLSAAAILVSTVAGAAPANAVIPTLCAWKSSVVASGLGSLENLSFDGSGAMLLSRTTGSSGQIYRLTPDGHGTTLVPDVASPGSIVATGGSAFFTTGNNFGSGILGHQDGTIDQADLVTGDSHTVARGLTMPNGMARLPDGTFIVSRNLGWRTGLTKVSADGQTQSAYAPPLAITNGVAYDPVRNAVITSLDLHPAATLAIIDIAEPERIKRIYLGLFGLIGFPDDLTVGADGMLYLAMDAGFVVRVNPEANSACILSYGLLGSTSVRFGSGPGWDPQALYVTDLFGTVHELMPART
jgi:hypothetical protein